MKLEDLCVSLGLAKELKENGYPQDSQFIWLKNVHVHKDFSLTFSGDFEGSFESEYEDGRHYETYAAPTASEIGEQMKDHRHIPDGRPGSEYDTIFPEWHDGKWQIQVATKHNFAPYRGRYTTESEARGHAWLYLKKNNLLKEEHERD